jgi:N-methylhydantoinase B
VLAPALGGGDDDPLARDPAAVLEDVIDGYVSTDGAYRDYAVVIRERDWEALDYELDLDATHKARQAAVASNREKVSA